MVTQRPEERERYVALRMIDSCVGLLDGQSGRELRAGTRRDVTYRRSYMSQSQTQTQSRPGLKHAVGFQSRMRQV
jgi:hypothetical protein